MISSPALVTPSSDEIMASVDPQQTVISVYGSISTPRHRRKLRAIAWRSDLAPQVIAYWLTSAAMASWAARLISAGGGQSGRPCARLVAWGRLAGRGIA